MHDPWFDGLFYMAILGLFSALLLVGLGVAHVARWLFERWRGWRH